MWKERQRWRATTGCIYMSHMADILESNEGVGGGEEDFWSRSWRW